MSGFPAIDPRAHQVALAKCELAEFLLSKLVDKFELTQNEILYILNDLAVTTASYAIHSDRAAAQPPAPPPAR